MTSYTARALTTDKLQVLIAQAHTFVVGDVITFNGTIWVKSQANNLAACKGTCMVTFVIDANNFILTQEGHVFNITVMAFTPGTQYYVNPAATGLTSTAPSTAGEVNLPCFVADTTTSGYFFGGSGQLIESGQLFTWNTENAGPVNMAVNQGYITNSGGTINLNLPATASVGDIIRITNNAGNFSIRQTNAQFITFGADETTPGPTGHIDTTDVGDTVELLCVVAGINTEYQVLSSMGNLTIV